MNPEPRTLKPLEWNAMGVKKSCTWRMPFHWKLNPSKANANGEVVVLIHGLGLNLLTMLAPGIHLRRQGYQVYLYDYPTFRHGIDRHAEDFAAFLGCVASLCSGQGTFHVVSHSMGGIVARKALFANKSSKVGRFVMMAPPNQGSPMAGRVARLPLMRRLIVPLTELDDAPGSPIHAMPVPKNVEIGVIAGARGDGKGWKWYMRGDDDGKVAVKDTHISGEKDHIVIPVWHSLIMYKPEVLRQMAYFLRNGRFLRPAITAALS